MRGIEMERIQDLPQTVLSHERMEDLIRASQKGDEGARQILVQYNLRLVLKIVHRFKNKGQEMDDLFQIGTIGLLQAINKFDLSRRVKFSTYAVPLIIGEIKRFIRDHSSLRLSRSLQATSHEIRDLEEKFLQENGRRPSVSEVAQLLDLSPEEVVAAMEGVKQPLSIHQKIECGEGEGDIYLHEQLADPTRSRDTILERLDLSRVIHQLTKKEKKILFFRYIQELTQEEIGAVLGVSQVQVSRLEKKILERIRSHLIPS